MLLHAAAIAVGPPTLVVEHIEPAFEPHVNDTSWLPVDSVVCEPKALAVRVCPLLSLLQCHISLINIVTCQATATIVSHVERALQSLLRLRNRSRWLPVLTVRLANPNLRDPLGGDGGRGCMKSVGVQFSVHEAGEKNKRAAFLGFDFEVDAPECSCAALWDVIEVHQHRAYPLATICTECAASLCVRINTVVMLNIALAVSVACHLWQLHVTKRLVGERLYPLEQHRTRMRFLGQVACEACPPLGCLTPCNGVRL
mmetsp:Transcript_59099/g.117452  ORF Transcript_59099/g.117452 Transcript_59099/m.117452 type:complete len:256 (-) Transcript_59099:280-1047(-)